MVRAPTFLQTVLVTVYDKGTNLSAQGVSNNSREEGEDGGRSDAGGDNPLHPCWAQWVLFL